MTALKLKICGMRDPDNINAVVALQPDFMGFIFYSKSPRYAGNIDSTTIKNITANIAKVGVFVNADIAQIDDYVQRYGLSHVQLHGDEPPSLITALREQGLCVIKVLRIVDMLPVDIADYANADYLLFDTATQNYGGSGRHFDWHILDSYDLNTPFFLSGGICLQDIPAIKQLSTKQLVGIDVNSRFEIQPGLKDITQLRKLIERL